MFVVCRFGGGSVRVRCLFLVYGVSSVVVAVVDGEFIYHALGGRFVDVSCYLGTISQVVSLCTRLRLGQLLFLPVVSLSFFLVGRLKTVV